MTNEYYPLLPLKDKVLFPLTNTILYIGLPGSLYVIKKSLATDQQLIVCTLKENTLNKISLKNIYLIGCRCQILQTLNLKGNNTKVLLKIEERVKIKDIHQKNIYFAKVEPLIAHNISNTEKTTDLIKKIIAEFKDYIKLNKEQTIKFFKILKQFMSEPEKFIFFVTPILNFSTKEKLQILEETEVEKNLEKIFNRILQEKHFREIENNLRNKLRLQDQQSKQKLPAGIKIIHKEDKDDDKDISQEYDHKIKKAKLPSELEDIAFKECKKLNFIPSVSSEAHVIRTYLDWILQLPWNKKSKDNYILSKARRILEQDHYGLEKVKERIIEFIVASKQIGRLKSPIICLIGPPGVGKTSLAQSVAKTLNRKFVRVSLGGIRDEAEIRGHRRTYIGAMPGKIIQSIKKAGTSNPLLLLDEIDKLTRNYTGDPSAALLEVLDPEQNHSFTDHFINYEYDLSNILFFCTGNSLQNIPYALQDRMEIIFLEGYSELEKTHIFNKYLFPKQLKEHGLTKKQILFSQDIISTIIRGYTREAGIRKLERIIAKICRKSLVEFEDNKKQSIKITPKKLLEFLGITKYKEYIRGGSEVGVATGMAWTSVGGELIYIETTTMKGKGNILLTGQLGKVMKESAQIALSFVKSNAQRLNISHKPFQEQDLHIHIPEGATPKEGPSAGIPLVISIISCFTGIPVHNYIAMTGETTLRGRILQIGGLKEKILAAKRGGITDVVIPKENEIDDLAEDVLNGIKIHKVSTIWEVLLIALERIPLKINDDIADENQFSSIDEQSKTFPLS